MFWFHVIPEITSKNIELSYIGLFYIAEVKSSHFFVKTKILKVKISKFIFDKKKGSNRCVQNYIKSKQ